MGASISVPSIGGKQVFDPSPLATILVAAALLLAALIILGRIGLFGDITPRQVFRWPTAGIAVVFFVRAIGDFRLVGFFKQASESGFAYWDTWLFSPMCVLIAAIACLLSIRDV